MWSERQNATKTAEFHWVETTIHPPHVAGLDKRIVAIDDRDCILRLGTGATMRSQTIPVQKSPEPEESLTRPGLAISAFNGKRNAYYTAAMDAADHHRGIEFDAEVYDEIVNYHLRAAILWCRPLQIVRSQFSSKESRIVRHNSNLSIIDLEAELDEVRCLIIESRSDASGIDHYWVDIARHGLILKHVEIYAGRPTAELTINYKNDDEHGWVPENWKARFPNGNYSVNASVIDFKLNASIAAEMFEIAYPSGTVLFDRDKGKQWQIGADGNRELITPIDSAK